MPVERKVAEIEGRGELSVVSLSIDDSAVGGDNDGPR